MVECNRGCGALDLHWKIVNSKYKLFGYNDLLHICNDGKIADQLSMEKATAKILNELGIREPAQIPKADKPTVNVDKGTIHGEPLWVPRKDTKDASKMFTISSTANGIAITGDDKHTAIYLPKVAVPELVKALMDFIC